MAEHDEKLEVEVAYGTAEKQTVVRLDWHSGMTVREAVDHSGILTGLSRAEAGRLLVGIFGTPVAETQALRPGDRVDLCRPLLQDPRDMRRAALSAGKVIGRGD